MSPTSTGHCMGGGIELENEMRNVTQRTGEITCYRNIDM